MKTRHTPGPWRFVANGAMEDDCNTPRIPVPFDFTGPGYYNNPSIEGPGGETVVGCGEYLVFGPNFNCDKGTRAANVALMCAAPDLLASLEVMLAQAEIDTTRFPKAERLLRNVAMATARAAIAKATGNPS